MPARAILPRRAAKKLARARVPLTPTGVNTWHRLGLMVAGVAVLWPVPAAEPVLTRPGQIVISALAGEATLQEAGKSRPAKPDDRVRVDTAVTSGRLSLVTLAFSNGAVLELGPDSQVEIEELLQAPYSLYPKPETLKEEPSVSQTRVRLVRGTLQATVKPLQVAKGSVFAVVLPAGGARVTEGALRASVQMSEAGMGVCTVQLDRGEAEFEVVGARAANLPPGQRHAFAVEVNRVTGAVTVGEMPKAASPRKE